MTASDHWSPLFVLPNLSLLSAVECANVALLPPRDERVEAFGARHAGLASFLKRFKDAFGTRLGPAVLMLRDEAPASYRTIEAAAGFRNLVAVSVIAYARALLATHPTYSGIFWGDAFTFHPWMATTVGDDNEHVVGRSPALLHLHLVEEFHGQSSPAMPVMELSPQALDRPLFEALVRRWERCFGQRRRHDDTKLFRSLNMAYNASLIPAASYETLAVDVGRLLGLWVSAFEILAHPGRNNEVRRDHVLAVLDAQCEWCRKDIEVMTFPIYDGKNNPPRHRKLPSWFYLRLLKARNDFLHGNRVTKTSHRVEPRGKKSLLDIAAPLYRFALSSMLGMKPPPIPSRKWDSHAFADAYVTRNTKFVLYQNTYEQALVASLTRSRYKALFGPVPPNPPPRTRPRQRIRRDTA